MSSSSRRKLGWILTAVFLLAMLMGPGPGLLLVNRPTMILGLPALYAWGLLWYAVEATVVICAFVFVWRKEPEEVQFQKTNRK